MLGCLTGDQTPFWLKCCELDERLTCLSRARFAQVVGPGADADGLTAVQWRLWWCCPSALSGLQSRVAEGLSQCPLYCLVHGTALVGPGADVDGLTAVRVETLEVLSTSSFWSTESRRGGPLPVPAVLLCARYGAEDAPLGAGPQGDRRTGALPHELPQDDRHEKLFDDQFMVSALALSSTRSRRMAPRRPSLCSP